MLISRGVNRLRCWALPAAKPACPAALRQPTSHPLCPPADTPVVKLTAVSSADRAVRPIRSGKPQWLRSLPTCRPRGDSTLWTLVQTTLFYAIRDLKGAERRMAGMIAYQTCSAETLTAEIVRTDALSLAPALLQTDTRLAGTSRTWPRTGLGHDVRRASDWPPDALQIDLLASIAPDSKTSREPTS